MYVEATQIENTIVKKSVSIKSKSISKKYREAQKIITKNSLNVGKIVKWVSILGCKWLFLVTRDNKIHA